MTGDVIDMDNLVSKASQRSFVISAFTIVFCLDVRIAAAQSLFVDWTAADTNANTASGALGTSAVSVTTDTLAPSPNDSGVQGLDLSIPFFANNFFSPRIALTNAVGLASASSYTIQFSAPVANPVLHIFQLADSRLNFFDLSGPISFKLLSSDNFFDVVTGNVSTTILGQSNATDANGSLLFAGTHTQISWSVSNGNTGDGMVIQISVPTGDYNGNGKVDAADYVVWRKMLNQTGTNLSADGNLDGKVDDDDYQIWRTNFGTSVIGASAENSNRPATTVPEPATATLAAIGALVILLRCSSKP